MIGRLLSRQVITIGLFAASFSANADTATTASTLVNAQLFFDQGDYQKAILFLGSDINTREARFILAESLFRLGSLDQAKKVFDELLTGSKDKLDKEIVSIRLLDIALAEKDQKVAISRFEAFIRDFKIPPGRLAYGMGKMLYDNGYLDHAEKILKNIPEGDEYFVRAAYIVAAIRLGKDSKDTSIQAFNKIENSKIVATEDAWVRDLAILAQMRIAIDAEQLDQALNTYLRLPLTSAFLDTGTAELIRAFMAKLSVDRALRVILRYQTKHEISVKTPELLLVMGQLMTMTERFDDARRAFDDVINHFRPLRETMLEAKKSDQVWPYFALDYDKTPTAYAKLSLVDGVPASLVRNLSGINEILAMRDRILASGKKLADLEEILKARGEADLADLNKARNVQKELESEYKAVALLKQEEIRKKVADILGLMLADAEFSRARSVSKNLTDIREEQTRIQDFTSQSLDTFDRQIDALEKNVTP